MSAFDSRPANVVRMLNDRYWQATQSKRMRAMLESRRVFYRAADVTIDTEDLAADEVSAHADIAIKTLITEHRIPVLSLQTPAGRSDMFVTSGVSAEAGALLLQRWPSARRVWIVADRNVAQLWGASTVEAMAACGLVVEFIEVEPGESTKQFAEVERLCNQLTTAGVTRRDVIIALGGGVVGDLAGFVASIVLRGLSLVQMPTSLLAMVDSSVGGKTGVNTAAGKNLVGAFYQPGIVAIDPTLLETLPRAEFRSGMGEVIKHSIIQPSTPFGGTSLARLLADVILDPVPTDVLAEMLRLNIAIKHSVVQADERETGLRMILNFGHTAGHAIEADGYRYRHGEAIALGMCVASRIAHMLGRVDGDFIEALETTIERAGLPKRMSGSLDAITGRLASDKKNIDGALNWILPMRTGGVERVTGVPLEIVRAALREVGAN